MKKLLLSIGVLFTITLTAQTPCSSGNSIGFPCDNYGLQSNIPLSTFGANSSNDSWGWTDPDTGKEYAIIGLRDGSAYVDITDPVNPIYVGKLISPVLDEFRGNWHDVKVYNNYAFIVSEIDAHGMQIFDLTKLRNVSNPPVNFADDGVYTGFGRAHNVAINTDTGFAYGVGTDTFSGGAHFVNIQDPTNPIAAGGYANDGYTHDAQVVIYNGPDTDYQGIELYIGSNENEVVFVNVSDKNNPQNINSLSYNNFQYTHQGWLTEDHRYFLVTDELDEVFNGNDLRIIVMDVTDLDNPVVHMEYFGNTPAVDHNIYVKGDKAYLSAYTAGMRVLDLSDIDNMNITEVGFFDTWPADDNTSASIGDPGAWNVYPFFESGNLVVSNFSDNGGLFVLAENNIILDTPSQATTSFSVFPNPANNKITVNSGDSSVINEIKLFDVTGKLLLEETNINADSKVLDISLLSSGMYMVSVNNQSSIRVIKH